MHQSIFLKFDLMFMDLDLIGASPVAAAWERVVMWSERTNHTDRRVGKPQQKQPIRAKGRGEAAAVSEDLQVWSGSGNVLRGPSWRWRARGPWRHWRPDAAASYNPWLQGAPRSRRTRYCCCWPRAARREARRCSRAKGRRGRGLQRQRRKRREEKRRRESSRPPRRRRRRDLRGSWPSASRRLSWGQQIQNINIRSCDTNTPDRRQRGVLLMTSDPTRISQFRKPTFPRPFQPPPAGGAAASLLEFNMNFYQIFLLQPNWS